MGGSAVYTCTASFQKFSHPGLYYDKKGYNTSGIEICHGTSQGARTFGMGLYFRIYRGE